MRIERNSKPRADWQAMERRPGTRVVQRSANEADRGEGGAPCELLTNGKKLPPAHAFEWAPPPSRDASTMGTRDCGVVGSEVPSI